MPAPQSAEEFLSVVRRSGLFSPEECDALPWRYDLRDKKTAAEVAHSLLERKVLTRYQARRLLQGGGRGLRLDGYRVLDLLGVGGMGWVYLAEEVATGWKVAVKVLADKHRRDWGMLSRFQLEAQSGMKLTHPNIIRTKGIFVTEDIYGPIHYIVTEFIQGITLFELIALKRNLPWRQACDIIHQAALGLHYAHQLGMIHRDVKPENVLVRSDGTVKVLDFGLAMIDKSDDEFAMAMIHGQNCLGTADYVAPEQSIDSFKVDARADVYSLGCAFYFALTGQVPFPIQGKSKAESTSMKLKCHRQVKPKPVSKLRPELPDRVCAIVERMMAKRLENRLQTAGLVAQLLAPWARREPVEFDFQQVLRYRQKEAEKRRTVVQAGRTAASRGNASGVAVAPDVNASTPAAGSGSTPGGPATGGSSPSSPQASASSVAGALGGDSTIRESLSGSSAVGPHADSFPLGNLSSSGSAAAGSDSLGIFSPLGSSRGSSGEIVASAVEVRSFAANAAEARPRPVPAQHGATAPSSAPRDVAPRETTCGDDTGVEKRER